jgi:hypothetical protein
MNQLDTVTINDANETGVGHKAVNPVGMGIEQTKQARAMRQFRKEMQPVVFQPAIKGSIATSFKGKEQGKSDHFTGKKRCLGIFGRIKHLVIHLAEQFDNKIFGRHWILLSDFWFVTFRIGKSGAQLKLAPLVIYTYHKDLSRMLATVRPHLIVAD